MFSRVNTRLSSLHYKVVNPCFPSEHFSRRNRELGRQSFPRKRESNTESIAGEWVPAFAGMTASRLAVAFGCGFAALCCRLSGWLVTSGEGSGPGPSQGGSRGQWLSDRGTAAGSPARAGLAGCVGMAAVNLGWDQRRKQADARKKIVEANKPKLH